MSDSSGSINEFAEEIMKLFRIEDIKHKETLYRVLEKHRKGRKYHFLKAFCLLSAIEGVTFPDMCIDALVGGDTATLIKVGSYQGDLHGCMHHGVVATLENEDGDKCFKTFDKLVHYIKGVVAEQSKSVVE